MKTAYEWMIEAIPVGEGWTIEKIIKMAQDEAKLEGARMMQEAAVDVCRAYDWESRDAIRALDPQTVVGEK